ncbi:MAG: phenylalanine--tRNA ligase subunit beta [Chloroflexi bacterium]|nr:phenylalanine--tRNA ligase subunit beta [Chloroflexota bacterium]
MKVSLKWLRDYVQIDLPVRELAHRLSMSGTEVEAIDVVGDQWAGVIVARIVRLDPHPQADRLQLCTVDLGDGRTQTVVTGAPNVYAGMIVPFAPVGTRIVDGHSGKPAVLKPAMIRGVRSEGMVLSEKELGLSEAHEGIMALPEDAPVGAPLGDYLGDTVLDLAITPNRPDCLSVLGVAREVAALTGQRIRLPAVAYREPAGPIDEWITVRVDDPDLAPRYTGALVTDLQIGPSPAWMQKRLTAAGMRPINNVVDVTNYVMLEYGQPLHAFDYDRIRGKQIIVRRARPGERLETLDSVVRDLTPEMLAIADAEGSVGLAGVMGGANSEVDESTRTIFLESANFLNTNIRRTARHLRLRSEASLRFERGISPWLADEGLRRAVQLFAEIAGGKPARGIVDCFPGRKARTPIRVPVGEFRRLLGIDWPVDRIVRVLEALEFEVSVAGTGAGADILATPSLYRVDVAIKADVVEEVARIVGYDELPATAIAGTIPSRWEDPERDLAERLRDLLCAAGLQEIITYSLVGYATNTRPYVDEAPPAPPMRLANPMNAESEYLRTTIRGGLLQALAANQRTADEGIRLFEVGKVYLPREADLPDEPRLAAGVLAGRRGARLWSAERDLLDFSDAKGAVQAVLERLRLSAEFEPSEDRGLHPGKTAAVVVGGRRIGVVGELHPAVAERYGLLHPASLFELDLRTMLAVQPAVLRYQPIPRFPGVERDLAVVADVSVPAAQVEAIIRAAPLVREVTLFDVYQGDPLPPDKRSLAYSVLYQSPSKTLTDEEVDRIQARTIARLREIGATLR